MLADRWIVNVKGGDPIFAGFEIAVVRESYSLGRESCGWFEKDRKRLISAAAMHGWGAETVTDRMFELLLELARNIAAELNASDFAEAHP